MSVVLITGVSRFLGCRLAARLVADPSIDRVIGVDTATPKPADLARLGRTEFVRADMRNPLAGRIVAQAGVTTVVHTSLLAAPRSAGGRVQMQEHNVLGTMQLLAACQRSDTVRRVVLKSTATIYGSGPGQPAVLTEATPAARGSRTGFAKDAVEVESYLRGFARRRPDIEVTVLRVANLMGAEVDSALTRYLAMPVVPTPLGYDPRLQLLHDSDAVEALRMAASGAGAVGTFNLAGVGTLMLSQLLRRTGRIALPVPASIIRQAGRLVRNTGVAEFSDEEERYLRYGRVLDTTALRETFGYTPAFTTTGAVEDFAAARRRAVVAPNAPVAVGV